MPGLANLEIYQGDDFIATVTVLNTDGTVADLTGYVAQSQVRLGPADSNSIVAAQFQCSIVGNTITMVLTHNVTLNLNQATYVWDLQIMDANSWVTTLLAGTVQVTKDITRSAAARLAPGSVRVPLNSPKTAALIAR
jgi:hypothetical protein